MLLMHQIAVGTVHGVVWVWRGVVWRGVQCQNVHINCHENISAATEYETQNTVALSHVEIVCIIHFVTTGKWVKISCEGGYWVNVVSTVVTE